VIAQVPTITRKNVDKPNTSKDTCTIHNHDFQGLSAKAILNLFRAATIQTLRKHLTEVAHKHQNQTAISLDCLSQANQALIQALDSMQPSTPWHTDERHNTMVFIPTEVDYNPLRLQKQPYVILFQDPRSIGNTIKFSIKPPRIRSHTRGDEACNPWWRTALLVYSINLLPLLNMSDNNAGDTNGYLRLALHHAKKTTETFLSSI
jgi:hypothetical protein